MSKVIESDFLPRESDASFSWQYALRDCSLSETHRVLVIDDDPDTTQLIKLFLERKGDYRVFEENDPHKAHQTARNLRPDVILLDVVMPEVDGGEVAARIQNDPVLQSTPIIFLTALVTKGETQNGLEIQGHSFLAKPISIHELIEAIDRYLPARAKFG
jgi:two-component system OmpR family response regulator